MPYQFVAINIMCFNCRSCVPGICNLTLVLKVFIYSCFTPKYRIFTGSWWPLQPYNKSSGNKHGHLSCTPGWPVLIWPLNPRASSGTECGMQLWAGESNHFGHFNHHNQSLPADVSWSDQYQFSRQLKRPHQPRGACAVGACGSGFPVNVRWKEQVLGLLRPGPPRRESGSEGPCSHGRSSVWTTSVARLFTFVDTLKVGQLSALGCGHGVLQSWGWACVTVCFGVRVCVCVYTSAWSVSDRDVACGRICGVRVISSADVNPWLSGSWFPQLARWPRIILLLLCLPSVLSLSDTFTGRSTVQGKQALTFWVRWEWVEAEAVG